MAIIYVDSGALGANTGLNKTDAYLSVASVSPSAGDVIWISHTHSESVGNTSLSWSNAAAALSVDFGTDAVASGAQCTSTGYWVIDCKFIYGITFQAVSQIQFPHGLYGVADTCVFKGTYLNHYEPGEFINCTFDQSSLATWQPNRLAASGIRIRYRNISISPATTTNQQLFDFFGFRALIEIEDSDLSQAWSTAIFEMSTGGSTSVLRRCKVADTTKIVDGDTVSSQQFSLAEQCGVGTLTTPPLFKQWSRNGKIEAATTRYRTLGANDGAQANEHSWSMVSTSAAIVEYSPLESPPIRKWVSAGTQTLTLNLATDVTETLHNDEFWIEVSTPAESGPTAQHMLRSTRATPLVAATELTQPGTNNWNGLNVGKAYIIEQQISPLLEGWVTIRCYLAKPSVTHCYVDPKIEVS